MQSPLIVIVIMVKDEAKVIVNTLMPFVQYGLTHMCVFDTGSTDSTVEVTKSFFTENNISGFVDQEPFVDFATSRNRALEFAESHFPHAAFFLMIDANWYINNVQSLIEFCEDQKTKSDPLYNIRLRASQIEIASPRLFRASACNRYVGAVHEVPERRATSIIPDVFFELSEDQAHMRKSRARFKRDEEILLAEFEKNPFNHRALFYLAQTYECLEDIKNAYKFYLKRSVIPNPANPEENAVTFFRLGYLAEHLCVVDESFSWDMAMEYYLKSFVLRTTRIEPLLAIASYYLPKYPQISFVYLKHACSVPFPKNDMVFIRRDMYEFARYDLLSVCAWSMGEFKIGKEATEKALQVQPENPALQQRLRLYEAELKRLKTDTTFAPQEEKVFPQKGLTNQEHHAF